MLKLSYIGNTTVPVEIEGFTPDWAADKSLDQVRNFEIFHGNRKLPLAEMFEVEGEASDRRFEFHGDLSGVHWIGAQMESGDIAIHGSGGRHIGSEMTGGAIHVHGDAGGWVGAEMHGGFIHVHGNAGHLVGSAYRGSVRGMTGGTILVEGNAGNEIGLTMRRGVIAIGGDAGDMLGFNMIAGTVMVFGQCGIRPGAGMRRGTLALLGPNAPPLLPSFKYSYTAQQPAVTMILLDLMRQGMPIDKSLLNANYQLYHGDQVALGRGEIFLPLAA